MSTQKAKNRAQQLREEARRWLEVGNYRRVRRCLEQAAELDPSGEAGTADPETLNLQTDRAALGVGLATTVVYLLAWLLVI